MKGKVRSGKSTNFDLVRARALANCPCRGYCTGGVFYIIGIYVGVSRLYVVNACSSLAIFDVVRSLTDPSFILYTTFEYSQTPLKSYPLRGRSRV